MRIVVVSPGNPPGLSDVVAIGPLRSANLPQGPSNRVLHGDAVASGSGGQAGMDSTLLELNDAGDRLTHYLFRYPAKFHPPVVDALLDRYATSTTRLLDPFCGSSTSLVQAAVRGIKSYGTDVDPVAIAVSRAKTRRYDMTRLRATTALLLTRLAALERPEAEYTRRMFTDLTDAEFTDQLGGLWVPDIPKRDHWFRRYVLVDLARIHDQISRLAGSDQQAHKDDLALLSVVLASVLRNASNADPVPVSGLEVTRHMIEKDKLGRLINPFALYRAAVAKALTAVESYSARVKKAHVPLLKQWDATQIADAFDQQFSLVLTSPPYHNAVDYYRRHQLEMFWLGQVATQQDRLELLPKYIGRHRIPASHPLLATDWTPSALAKDWEQEMRAVSASRANDFRHYLISMGDVFAGLAGCVSAGGVALLVVGKSAWNGNPIPTTELFTELAAEQFQLEALLHYPVRNRYMSYTRRNGADINTEHVLVLRRTDQPAPEREPPVI